MKLSELIKQLEELKTKHGDVQVKTQTLSHMWDPEPVIREPKGGGDTYVLMNP